MRTQKYNATKKYPTKRRAESRKLPVTVSNHPTETMPRTVANFSAMS
jgi:hypothetical protein